MSLLLAPLLLLVSDAAAPAKATLPPAHTTVSPASDTVPNEPFRERPLLLEAQVGLAMPTGLVGAYVDYAFVPALSLAAGVGSNLSGFEVAGELRLRVVMRRQHALGFLGGYSAGPHVQSQATQFGFFSLFLGPMTSMGEPRIPSSYRWDVAHWANCAVFYERRKPSGTDFRFFGGIATLLNPDDARASATTAEEEANKLRWEPTSTMFFAGFSMGYAL